MNILMLIPHLGYGGAERSLLRLADQLSNHHSVDIAVFSENYGEGYSSAAPPSVQPVHRLDDEIRGLRLLRWWRRARRLRELRKVLKTDVTISFLSGPNFLNAITRGPGKTIVSVRGSRKHDAYSGRLEREFYRWVLDPITFSLSNAIVAISQGLTREVAGRGWAGSGAKFQTIGVTFDPEQLLQSATSEIEPQLQFLNARPLIVSAGRLSREKGFQHLIRVFAQVRRVVPNAGLLLIGDGPDRQGLEDHCRRHGLPFAESGADVAANGAAVIFLGYRANPNRYFKLARLFALPSAAEGYCNVLIEALASGLPVVAADVPWGPREILGAGPDPSGRAFPRQTPLETPYGTLMPRIDRAKFRHLWTQVLAQQLTTSGADAAAARRRQQRVREIAALGNIDKWEALLAKLLANESTEVNAQSPDQAAAERVRVS